MKYLVLILILCAAFFTADSTSAFEGFVTCQEADECNFCSLVEMINGITEWLIMVGTLLAVLLLAFSGFKLIFSGGDASALGEAKKIFISSVIGILIMLSGWTVVDTFLKVVAGGDLGVWNVVDCGGTNAYKDADSIDVNLEVQDGIDFDAVESFTGDHGDGSGMAAGPDVIVGTGGNCPGASASEVTRILDDTKYSLRRDAAANYVRMRSAAASDGVTLRLSSAWRSQASQEEIWKRHNCDLVGCRGTVARPCSMGGNGSNHNGGVAVDISGSVCGSTIFNWLKANGGQYGFNNNLDCRDPYHWSQTGR